MGRSAARQAALFGLLGAVLFGAKTAMAPLPNIEPVSLLVMVFAVCLGWRGLYAIYTYVLLDVALWGIGPWSLCYLYVWLVLFCLARLLRAMEHPLGWAVLSGTFGLLFGALCALAYWAVGGWAFALSWWMAGIPMDLLHGAGNFVLALTLFRTLRRWMERLCRWFGFTP
ncbi:MAG: hypothetical protein HFF50_02040 [Lawsonibacter sp.]|nr:hypothetical protein [Lawsonibacter sp.]